MVLNINSILAKSSVFIGRNRPYREQTEPMSPMPARPRPRPVTTRRSHLGKGLALLFLLGLGTTAYLYWPLMQRLGSQLHTDTGERRSLRLADGTLLHLEGASAMNADLRGRTRQLHLVQGQVAIEVMLDGRAMEVTVGDARIQVFGTRLQVARRADHDELVVLTGKAMVTQDGEQRLVSAGERVTFDGERIGPVQHADLKAADGWRSGQIKAGGMPLGKADPGAGR